MRVIMSSIDRLVARGCAIFAGLAYREMTGETMAALLVMLPLLAMVISLEGVADAIRQSGSASEAGD